VWSGPDAAGRNVARAAAHLGELVRALLSDRAAKALSARGGLTEVAQTVVDKRADPWTLAEQLVGSL
jgi:6-phosphogluconate dehydrogenase (decarboxylating)